VTLALVVVFLLASVSVLPGRMGATAPLDRFGIGRLRPLCRTGATVGR